MTATRSPDGLPMVLATVHTTGGRALDISGDLELLDGPGGLRAGPFPVNLGTTLAIGDTEPVTIVLDAQVPAGPWDAHIDLRSGLLEGSAEATITFPADGAITTPTDRGWWQLAISALLILLILGGASWFLVRRRRRHAHTPRSRRPTTPPIPAR
ncbi:MAG: hypothetical protein WEA10_05935 [Actinomycetota bacterium]